MNISSAKSGKKFDVLVAGELNIDLILNRLEKFPELNKEVLAHQMLLTLGSSSAIFASNLSVLGSRVAFCGRVGDDSFADKIVNDLQARSVNTDHIFRSRTADTGITVAFSVHEERAMVTYPGAMNEFSAAEITDEMLASAAHLHVSSIFLQPNLQPGLADLFARARALGLTTSLDPQWDPSEKWDCSLGALLPHISIFLPNALELLHLTGASSVTQYRDKMNGSLTTDHIIVLKKGNEGAELYGGGKVLNQPVFLNREVVDAIGAGDSFNAGFIHRFVQGSALEECLRFGALCGAINTTAAGGTTAFTDLSSVQQTASRRFNEPI